MKTVGEILLKGRQDKNLTLEHISKRTKISLHYLKLLENNEFKKLPPAAFTKGFIRNYAQVVGVNANQVLAIFRRDYDQDERGRIIPRSFEEPVKASVNFFTPKTTTITLSALLSLIIIFFFARQIITFLSAPSLKISAPPNNVSTTSPVLVEGNTAPEATITINQKPVTVDPSGNFSTEVSLTPGDHILVVESKSRSGKTRVEQRFVTIIEPEKNSL